MSDAPRGAALSAFVAGCAARGMTAGAAWRVDGSQDTLDRGVAGFACLDPAEPVVAETPWDLASLTKALATAPLLLLARQAGRLRLDDAAELHVPELRGTRWGGVSLQALATHTSGLPAWEPFYLSGRSLTEFLVRVGQLPEGNPGAVEYSDPGYLVLGAAIERAWDATLDELFERHLRRPLGLTRMGFAAAGSDWSDAAATELGNAYERELVGDRGARYAWRTELIRGTVHDTNCWTLGGVAGHAGLFGTLDDVVRLVRGLLSPNGPFDPDSRRRWLVADETAVTRTVGLVTAAGSAAARGALPDAAPGHVGFTGTSCWIEPGAGRSYVLLTNRVHPRVAAIDFQAIRNEFHRQCRRLPD